MIHWRDVHSHHDRSESVINDQEKNNMMKVKVLFMITKRSIKWKWNCYLWLRKDQYDESESVICDYKKINMQYDVIESVIKDQEKLNKIKVKILLKLTRKSTWWKRKCCLWSQEDQQFNMMKLNLLLMIRRRSIWRKWKCQQGSHFVAGSCCGVMMIADRQMTSFVFICSTMVMMSMIIIVMMYDDHCDDIWCYCLRGAEVGFALRK